MPPSFHDVHGDVRFHIVPGKAVPEIPGELVHGHAAGVDFPHQRKGNSAVRTDGVGCLLGILEIGADVLLLDDYDIQLIPRAQGIFFRPGGKGQGSQGKGMARIFFFMEPPWSRWFLAEKYFCKYQYLYRKSFCFVTKQEGHR